MATENNTGHDENKPKRRPRLDNAASYQPPPKSPEQKQEKKFGIPRRFRKPLLAGLLAISGWAGFKWLESELPRTKNMMVDYTVNNKRVNYLDEFYVSKSDLTGKHMHTVLLFNQVAERVLNSEEKASVPAALEEANRRITLALGQEYAPNNKTGAVLLKDGTRVWRDREGKIETVLYADGKVEMSKQKKADFETALLADITDSLYITARAQKVPESVIRDLMKIYSSSVDFQSDLEGSSKFDVLYEQDSLVSGWHNILYANLNINGQDRPVYRYTGQDGITDYYDAGGNSFRQGLLKTPLEASHIKKSDGFGMRLHPIYHVWKMHKGKDFAAPRGTDIYAAADGVIETIRYSGTFGNFIRIRHNENLETVYGHMSDFGTIGGRKLKVGDHVKKGAVIGKVGATGAATGNHLHFEVVVDGVHVDPASINLPAGKVLTGAELAAFNEHVRATNAAFTRAGPAPRTKTAKLTL